MRFSKIKDNDIANGVGITMSLWTQGCPHCCEDCFNKETWDFHGGKKFIDKDKKYIFENINKNNIKRNLSILGGEPLCPQNVQGVEELCKEFKEKYPEKLIYLWTGYEIENFNENQRAVLKYIDILIDGPFKKEKRNLSLTLRGSSNQRIIDIRKTFEEKNLVLSPLNS